MKSNSLYLIFFLCLNGVLLAQQTSLSVEMAPISSYRVLKSNNSALPSELMENLLDSLESPLWGKRFFIAIRRELNQKFLLNIGIGYKQTGTTITHEYGYYNPDPDSFLGFDLSDYRIYKEQRKQKFEYMSLMMGVGRIFVVKKKILFSPTINTSIDDLFDRNIPEENIWIKHPNFAVTLNLELRLSYKFSNRFHLFVAPIFERQITPMRTIEYSFDEPSWNGKYDFKIKQYGYWYGANFGFEYSIKRS